MLEFKNVSKKVGNSFHIKDVSLSMEKGSLNVLLGPTLSGKTSLMRLMAGLDRPTSGEILMDGKNVVGMPVQKRNVAMVYQQFINYPAMTVYENIASPMRVAKVDAATIDRRVREAAELMKLGPYLDRTPLNLSGGQQQRTALARALVKDAELVLLDEPLANLDYKLREELRVELPKIFAATGAIFVYATTEPQEALLLGGQTATLHEGQITQFADTIDIYNRPIDLLTAQTFSDPPMNVITVEKKGKVLTAGGARVAAPKQIADQADGTYKMGVRPHHATLSEPAGESLKIEGTVTTTEITGSETFIHMDIGSSQIVALMHGVFRVNIGDKLPVYLEQPKFFVFDAQERLIASPQMAGA
ncbi:ABC transporter ATP-binding protein [Ahrensia sp. 13_GOM-1096m]|uniref:ABC transporter ATP-binding protein n=1 Tax=Ahrensia sp. 13_GOM-1096m TaxID=1380380 RepID=UPI000479EFCE|nr:ABC transporter ATP-binding protein [Ahrensia sp. 13_GOM-1096m]